MALAEELEPLLRSPAYAAPQDGATYHAAVDWPTAVVSIIGNVAVAGVAIWALRAQTGNAERDRQHDLVLRRQERRSGAYIELMTALHRLQTGVAIGDRARAEL
jgi:hypothetical protein